MNQSRHKDPPHERRVNSGQALWINLKYHYRNSPLRNSDKFFSLCPLRLVRRLPAVHVEGFCGGLCGEIVLDKSNINVFIKGFPLVEVIRW